MAFIRMIVLSLLGAVVLFLMMLATLIVMIGGGLIAASNWFAGAIWFDRISPVCA